MTPLVLVAIGLVVGAVLLTRVIQGDGYGRTPPPRSHRDEEALTQHEQLRRLVR